MNDHQGIEIVNRFFPGTGATYDHIVNLCTLGFDRWWKKQILAKIPHDPIRIMDQACGTGILTFEIAEKFPDCQVTGIDISEEYLGIAKEKAQELKVTNVVFMLGRAEEILLDQTFDCITSSYLAKYADLGALIPGIRKMLREGGALIMHDFAYPSNRVLAGIWEAYFKLLQTTGTFLYPQWKAAFHGLPGLLRETRWVCELVSLLQGNQFSEISTQHLSLGTSAIVAAKKGEATLLLR
jgi:demethylmenaquinone methyltransferase / 2-methoxy-6-polyprenyl-1,4-benzoquinol methylase